MGRIIEGWEQQASLLKLEIFALYFAYKDPRVPLIARIFAGFVVGYAFSPIDLIPDLIPFFGYLDDLVLIPFGINIAISMIPEIVMVESREKAHQMIKKNRIVNKLAAPIIILIWLVIAALIFILILKFTNLLPRIFFSKYGK
ncbi:MAG: YkvA family protein [Chloroflexota bacterium]